MVAWCDVHNNQPYGPLHERGLYRQMAAVEQFYLPNGLVVIGNEDMYNQLGKETMVFLSAKPT